METTRARTYDELLEENRQLRHEVEVLRERVAKLTEMAEQLRRQGKRQAAPFRKRDEPTERPKKPGRKSGRRHGTHAHRRVPPRIDETYDVPLPVHCSHCGGCRVRETHVAVQYQAEIPRQVIYRQFDVHVGACHDCGHTVQGRHALQTSTARGAAASQLGPNVHAVLAILNKQLGLSHGKSVKLLQILFEGLSVARATSVRSIERTGRRSQGAYEQLRQDIRGSPQVVPDETGWRVGGRNAWLHAFVGQRATCYVIDPTRSSIPAEQLLGSDWSGTLVHDGWSVYDRFTHAAHQQCLQHLQRRCQELLTTAERGAVRFPRAVLTLIDQAYALRRAWRGHRLSGDTLAEQGLALSGELQRLTSGHFTHEPNRCLAAHLSKHALHWFWFLLDPTIDATNYRGEQAIRPAVVNRKVWGGNRTWLGAKWQSILTSVIRTCEQRSQEAMAFLVRVLCQPTVQLIPE
jgi:transposase